MDFFPLVKTAHAIKTNSKTLFPVISGSPVLVNINTAGEDCSVFPHCYHSERNRKIKSNIVNSSITISLDGIN